MVTAWEEAIFGAMQTHTSIAEANCCDVFQLLSTVSVACWPCRQMKIRSLLLKLNCNSAVKPSQLNLARYTQCLDHPRHLPLVRYSDQVRD